MNERSWVKEEKGRYEIPRREGFGMYDGVTDVSDIRVGHFSHFEALMGCTVVLCEAGED